MLSGGLVYRLWLIKVFAVIYIKALVYQSLYLTKASKSLSLGFTKKKVYKI